jgi:hypothetical protein
MEFLFLLFVADRKAVTSASLIDGFNFPSGIPLAGLRKADNAVRQVPLWNWCEGFGVSRFSRPVGSRRMTMELATTLADDELDDIVRPSPPTYALEALLSQNSRRSHGTICAI